MIDPFTTVFGGQRGKPTLSSGDIHAWHSQVMQEMESMGITVNTSPRAYGLVNQAVKALVIYQQASGETVTVKALTEFWDDENYRQDVLSYVDDGDVHAVYGEQGYFAMLAQQTADEWTRPIRKAIESL
jgi:hypothetical protein